MLSRSATKSPQRLINRLRPPLAPAGIPGLVPALRAYSGFRVPEVRAERTSGTLASLGSLEVRLAHNAADVRRAQKVRYRVFYQERAAIADAKTMLARRDVDAFDAICDHLLVVDHAATWHQPRKPNVVGTYRMLRHDVARRHGGFYSAGEFDMAAMFASHRDLSFLEVGRSCVLPAYRNKRTIELLWTGLADYVARHRLDVLFGCASLDGIDPDELALPLSFLHHYAVAPAGWNARALPHRYVEMNRMPKEAIDCKAAWRALPPLIKGYLRLGGFVGEGAVADRQFGTTDVLVIVPMARMNPRYLAHFGLTGHVQAA